MDKHPLKLRINTFEAPVVRIAALAKAKRDECFVLPFEVRRRALAKIAHDEWNEGGSHWIADVFS